ncbi:MAG: hypothetical protein ACK4MV_09135 [Beijerinckiaceae bacterium]
MKTLIDNDKLTVKVIEHASSRVILCFTGIGHAIGGVDVQSPEFYNASQSATAVYVIDRQRSWGNNLNFAQLGELLEPYARDKVICSLGNSMGGFLAILATRFFPISSAVAIVPQYSVSRDVIPGETRWRKYVDAVRDWRFPSLAGSFNNTTQYYIVAAKGGSDDAHLALMPDKKNVQKIYFEREDCVHNVAEVLKSDGLLYPLISDCFAGKSAGEIIRARQLDELYNVKWPP